MFDLELHQSWKENNGGQIIKINYSPISNGNLSRAQIIMKRSAGWGASYIESCVVSANKNQFAINIWDGFGGGSLIADSVYFHRQHRQSWMNFALKRSLASIQTTMSPCSATERRRSVDFASGWNATSPAPQLPPSHQFVDFGPRSALSTKLATNISLADAYIAGSDFSNSNHVHVRDGDEKILCLHDDFMRWMHCVSSLN